ncbi:IS66 family insertion sequence element accessory protein TnpB [Tateyamaria pelophila]|uniref:IS66 family insertion sequence element accessory protein TnpB n=1 Tax=Tateyamaria pelophila TaxID=328415 RepID=UPI001CBC2AD5|nr:IS66 family insertion sequence element accessory protein TnpB [Tateyamaria pelophila]
MILPGGKYRVFLATRPVDFRKGHAGLSLVVQTVLGLDPYCGAVFVFRSKRGDRVKILVWDQTGLVMVYKHLEGGSFHWPTPADGTIKLSPAQFSALFEGLDWKAVRAERRRRPMRAG